MATSPSLLELSFGTRPDPTEFLRAAMSWHFDPETGSPFWIERARTLDFDPRVDVRTFADLSLFPNVVDELRGVPASRLIPRGYGPSPDVVGIIESGGTTGAPKAIPLMADFAQLMVERDVWLNQQYGLSREKNWLGIVPSGPHGAFEELRRGARAWGVLCFGVDLDPRWVKKLAGAGRSDQVDAYVEHVLDQVGHILRTQNIGHIRVTPPILARLIARDELLDIIQDNVELIGWGGASMDVATRDFYRDLFPGKKIVTGYGTTMALGSGGAQRFGSEESEHTIFDPNLAPYTSFEVRDRATGAPIPYGERGQLVVHHVSKAMLLPNNAERDEVTRIAPANRDQLGDSIGDIAPLSTFEGIEVIEGVY